MKFGVAAILALGVAPAYSFSYLDSLSTASPMTSISPPMPAYPAPPAHGASTDAPFFFTNGAKDEPADSPAFFFTNGSSTAAAAKPAPTTGSYLDNLGGGAAAAPTGAAAGASYLDALSTGATSVSGPGMTSYLDALPSNDSSRFGGAGLTSYASSLNQAAAAAPKPVAPAAPVATSASTAGPTAPTSGAYLEALSTGVAIGGPGLTGYLDALPRSATLSGGAGISTYISNIVSSNVVSGPGMTSYTDALGGRSTFSKSFSPFSGAASKPSSTFTIGSVTGRFDFSLHADAEMIEKLKAAGNRKVILKGTAYFSS
jgi:hypothetical protein